jgi:hypothetical protein
MTAAAPSIRHQLCKFFLVMRTTPAARRASLLLIQEKTMSEKFKDKMAEAGHKVEEAATKAGHKVKEGVEEAADWAKEKAHQAGHRVAEAAQKMENRTGVPLTGSRQGGSPAAAIREHMEVDASCGTCVGKVDHVEGNTIKLTKNDSPDGQHHRIPLSWVASVDDRVHLSIDHRQVHAQWQPA